MSGGTFAYKQFDISFIAEEIEQIIRDNEDACLLSKETIVEFEKAIEYLNLAKIYVSRIDWLMAGDDSEETFYDRLKQDLKNNM